MLNLKLPLEKFIDAKKCLLGFRGSVAEVSVFPGHDTALLSCRFATFRDNVAKSSFKTPGRWDHCVEIGYSEKRCYVAENIHKLLLKCLK